MPDFRLAVKGFITENKKVLILKRSGYTKQMPGIWELPGGRLEAGEDPLAGLQREIKEETGIEIEIVFPMSVRHFTREDGQIITMIIFLCKPKSKTVKLSSEHTEFEWAGIKTARQKMSKFYLKELELFEKNQKSFEKIFGQAGNSFLI
ncbi:MAG: NUDIX domain-containing protein [Candidatus ainarchaeum sp.]|nr:NUDIX domain-containing protein [Candidatus ainarchaeum sp.]